MLQFKKLLSKLFGKKNEVHFVTLQQEINLLNQMVLMSLKSEPDLSPIPHETILLHTAKVKEIIINLFNDGQLNMDRKTLDFLLSNIATQESMIISSYRGYSLVNPDIYNSQIGSSISEILKDIHLFVK